MLLLLPVLIGGVTAPPQAFAQPDDAEPPIADETTLSWTALGLPREVTFLGANTAQAFPVPLPSGFTPRRLRGSIHAPVNLGAGFVEINDVRGNFLAAVNIPPVAADGVTVPFDVDIAAAQVLPGRVNLSFNVRQLDTENQLCGPGQQLVLSNLSTVFAGTEPPPTTVETFFPPVLERVTIYAPVDADKSEQEAVLALASSLSRVYRPQPVAVGVVSRPRGVAPPPAAPLERAVVVERGSAGITVVNPGASDAHLRLAGRGDELTAQVAVVTSDLQSLVQSATARVDQATTATAADGDTRTFAELEMGGKTEVLRTSNLTMGVDRAALGPGRVDSVGVHLLADYTPVHDDDSATLVVRSDDQIVHTATLDRSGHLDATFDIPNEALTQRVTLALTLTYTPHFLCSSMVAPLTFQVDPQSTLTMTRGGTAPGGFDSLPSEFAPEFLVALDGGAQNQLDYAARVIVDMARLADTALTPRVVDVGAAASSDQPALIVANSASLKGTDLNPPVSGDGSSINVDGQDELRVNVDQGVGSMQAFADTPRNRTVLLITTTAAWTLVDPLFTYLDRLDDGWSNLTGDVLAAGAGGTPTDVALRVSDTLVAQAPAAASEPDTKRWVFIGAGAAVLVALAAAAVVLALRGHGKRA